MVKSPHFSSKAQRRKKISAKWKKKDELSNGAWLIRKCDPCSHWRSNSSSIDCGKATDCCDTGQRDVAVAAPDVDGSDDVTWLLSTDTTDPLKKK